MRASLLIDVKRSKLAGWGYGTIRNKRHLHASFVHLAPLARVFGQPDRLNDRVLHSV